jgi:hypothetical protein
MRSSRTLTMFWLVALVTLALGGSARADLLPRGGSAPSDGPRAGSSAPASGEDAGDSGCGGCSASGEDFGVRSAALSFALFMGVVLSRRLRKGSF